MLRGKWIKDRWFKGRKKQWHQQQHSQLCVNCDVSFLLLCSRICPHNSEWRLQEYCSKRNKWFRPVFNHWNCSSLCHQTSPFLYFVWDFSTLHALTNCDQRLVCLPRTCFPITGEWNKTQWSLKSKGYIRQPPRSIWISPNLVEPAWLWYSGGTN